MCEITILDTEWLFQVRGNSKVGVKQEAGVAKCCSRGWWMKAVRRRRIRKMIRHVHLAVKLLFSELRSPPLLSNKLYTCNAKKYLPTTIEIRGCKKMRLDPVVITR